MVFTDQLDRSAHSLASRAPGVAIGTLAMVFFAVALVSPRTIPFVLPALAVCAAAVGAGRSAWGYGELRRSYGVMGVAAFLALAAASALWASRWDAPLGASAVGFGYLLATVTLCEAMRLERRSSSFHIAEGMWIGFLAGLLYLLFEILSGQIIKLSLYRTLGLTPENLKPPKYFNWSGDYLVAISPFDLTRNIAPVTLYLWASLLAIRSAGPKTFARAIGFLLFAIAAVVIALSEHETSKVAIIVSTIVFFAAMANAEWTLRAVRVAWIVACIAIVPASLALYRGGLQDAPWLQWTARHRIVIWNHTAEEALKAPVLGFGAGMMYQLGSAPQAKHAGEEFTTNVPHAHNIYLQVWFELGAVGAAMLTLAGLLIIEGIARLQRHVAPYAQAAFVSAMVMAAASYGMWQSWFIAMFASSAAAFAVALRVANPREIPTTVDDEAAGRA